MDYTAKFGIDGGVSPGFGVKYPDSIERLETVKADSPREAMAAALKMAKDYSQDHLSNPNTDYTTVALLSLTDSQGKKLDQLALVGKGEAEFSNGCAVVKCSSLEHLLLLARGKEK
jgi:hypothetical protein